MSTVRESVVCNLRAEILKSQTQISRKITDSLQLELRKQRAIWKFRAIGRLVISNFPWLAEESDIDLTIGDVKTKVANALYGVSKKKQLLKHYDKTLLFKSAELRTDEEKEYLYRIIGGLKCFKEYPTKVKQDLAAVTYFCYYGPGRVVVKCGDYPWALYFVVSGELSVSKPVYDCIRNIWEECELAVLHSGDIFGQVSLLHNIPRVATCKTNTACELLYVMKDDFKNVLQNTLQKQWREVEDAMAQFTYFSSYDEVAIREACLLAKMESFEPQDTILGDGKGLPNFIYFILSGQCRMIETLYISSTKRINKTFYKLHKSKISDNKWKTRDVKNPSDLNVIMEQPKYGSSETEVKNKNTHEEQTEKLPAEKKMTKQGSRCIISDSNPCSNRFPANVKVYFMQVCLMNAGGCFGFGENMENRRFIANDNVSCLILPKHWLMTRNTVNIWTRIRHFLDKKIPSTEDLFEDFVQNRNWNDYKEDVVDSIVSQKRRNNWTSIHDVPYSIRIKEDIQFNN